MCYNNVLSAQNGEQCAKSMYMQLDVISSGRLLFIKQENWESRSINKVRKQTDGPETDWPHWMEFTSKC